MAEVKSKSTAPKTTATVLPKEVFAVAVNNHDLVKRAYEAYLANGRANHAVTKTRGLVSGGGKKPWRQKGTGRARVGSSRTPIWRGGGITFGPTGNENYTKSLSTAQKRQAIRQALTLSKDKIIVTEFKPTDGKVKSTLELLKKNKFERKVLIAVDVKDELTERATRNVANVKVVQATYLNVYDILNANHIVITKKSVALIQDWLSPSVDVKAKGGTNA